MNTDSTGKSTVLASPNPVSLHLRRRRMNETYFRPSLLPSVLLTKEANYPPGEIGVRTSSDIHRRLGQCGAGLTQPIRIGKLRKDC